MSTQLACWNAKSQINAAIFLSSSDAGISVKSSIIDCRVRNVLRRVFSDSFDPLEPSESVCMEDREVSVCTDDSSCSYCTDASLSLDITSDLRIVSCFLS